MFKQKINKKGKEVLWKHAKKLGSISYTELCKAESEAR